MRVNCMTSDGLAPAGRLGVVANKLRLFVAVPARGRGEIGRRTGLKIPRPDGCAGSSPAVRTIGIGLGLTLASLLGACDRRPDDVPVEVSVIGDRPLTNGIDREPLSDAGRLLRDSVAQGLVRFDATGGIEPGLAERWIVIDGGRSLIFRLSDARWPDGSAVVARDVVAQLRRALASRPGNTLAPYLTAIDEIVAMTPQVVEVRLTYPRPDMLKLFAQPELGIVAPREDQGSGPFRIARSSADGILLRPVDDPDRADDDSANAGPQELVRLRAERASAAVVRFGAERSDLVLGGTFVDWPLVPLSGVSRANVRLDPAAGLFGLLVASRSGFLATRDNRSAIALVVDRSIIASGFADGWEATDAILPETLDSASPPAQPDWASVPESERVPMAQARVAQYLKQATTPVRLRIALPEGPGATLLYAQLARAIGQLGIATDRVPLDDEAADLRLLDRVAPYDSARWYLRAACQPCALPIAKLIADIRTAPDLAARGRMLAQADSALTADVAFIPIAKPLRWSLVAPRLRQWTPNARAFHPLNRLRPPPK